MRHNWKRLAVVAVLGVLAVIGWWRWPEDLFFPWLQPATTASPVSVVIGDNVHISQPHQGIAFTECVIAADPNRKNRLFASSLYWPHSGGTSIVGYLSDDGGATWTTSLELVSDQMNKERLADQSAVFGLNGDLYLVHMRMDDAKGGAEWFGKDGGGSLDWHCLPAGAATWEPRGRINRHVDRPWLAIGQTSSPNNGRLYCTANVGSPYLITSSDGGQTFQFPKLPYVRRGRVLPAPPVVLSDGTILAAFRCARDGQFVWQPQYIPTFRSSDGAQSLTAGAYVSNWKHRHLTPTITTTQGPSFPQMAVDPGSPHFADNLYCVWAQQFYNRGNTEWILFSCSTDRGRSWSAPVNLSEQPESGDPEQDYLAYIPSIAVNGEGIVAVTWYDRRGLPPPASDGSPKGWNLRMRVSLDGGAAWPPSVQVTSQASTGNLTGWHTAGLCADATGNFHPAWIDDRTGLPQLWTAKVTVK